MRDIQRTGRKALAVLATALLLAAATVVSGAGPALADTGGYPYWNMPCELYPYNPVGYCNTEYGPYDWGPARNGSASSQLSQYGYGYRHCTDYVAWKLASLGVLPAQYKGLGDAKAWGTSAAGHGLVDNTSPTVGSVAVSTAGSFGHVAFVTAVSGSQITVSQYNQAGTGAYSTQTGTASGLGFTSFVHFEKYETGGGGGGTGPTSELVYQDPSSSTFYMLSNLGSGPTLNTVVTGWQQPAWQVAGDFLGNGKDQLVYQDPGSTTIYMLSNLGSGPTLNTVVTGWQQPAWEAAGGFT
jgi:surface antigen